MLEPSLPFLLSLDSNRSHCWGMAQKDTIGQILDWTHSSFLPTQHPKGRLATSVGLHRCCNTPLGALGSSLNSLQCGLTQCQRCQTSQDHFAHYPSLARLARTSLALWSHYFGLKRQETLTQANCLNSGWAIRYFRFQRKSLRYLSGQRLNSARKTHRTAKSVWSGLHWILTRLWVKEHRSIAGFSPSNATQQCKC